MSRSPAIGRFLICILLTMASRASAKGAKRPAACPAGGRCDAGAGAIQETIAKARRTIEAVPYGGQNSPNGPHPVSLVTLDASGYPSARSVVPREIAPDLGFFRLNTRDGTRKLAELKANPRTTLHFHDQRGRQGWLTIKGNSVLEPLGDGRVDILFNAIALEAVNYNENLMADTEGWQPTVLLRKNGSWELQM
eukprot:TRINITY_DN13126_c0_g3_i1.p1 TRINITY_DN13126_c0_g3~~TRINITY_DN13126_c0_g3_i1.p1  ORF type:complete len:194 (+),score=32.69 TRINITY_DN13126_c0_g3_i1:32-613(+)